MLLKKILVFFVLVFTVYSSIFLYYYHRRYDDAMQLLSYAVEHEKDYFKNILEKENFKNKIELKDKFSKKIYKLYSLCSKAIKTKTNSDICQLQFNFSFDIFNNPQEIYIFYNFNEEEKEFFKNIATTRDDGSKVWKIGGEYVYWYYIFGFYDAVGYMFNQEVYKNIYKDNIKK